MVDSQKWTYKRLIGLVALIATGVFATSVIVRILYHSWTKNPEHIYLGWVHYPVTIGLPMAAIGALGLVLLLEYARGPIEFEGLGFKFKGASGPVVLWVFCYLAIAATIKLLWNDTYQPLTKPPVIAEQAESSQHIPSAQATDNGDRLVPSQPNPDAGTTDKR